MSEPTGTLARSQVAVAAPTTTGVALAPSPLETPLGRILEPYRAQLAPFLRDGITLDQVAAELVLASRKTPNLDKCPPPALVDAVCRALQTGGTIGRDVYIVPFFTNGTYEPTVMLDYKFEAALVVLAGGARSIDAENVYEKEPFEMQLGSSPYLHHQPLPPSSRGKRIGAYAIAHLGHGHAPKIKWLSDEQIEAIRKTSKQWSPAKVKDSPEWYGPKSAVHRVTGLLPKNPRLRAMMDLVDRAEREALGDPDEVAVVEAPAKRPALSAASRKRCATS